MALAPLPYVDHLRQSVLVEASFFIFKGKGSLVNRLDNNKSRSSHQRSYFLLLWHATTASILRVILIRSRKCFSVFNSKQVEISTLVSRTTEKLQAKIQNSKSFATKIKAKNVIASQPHPITIKCNLATSS
ncbi:predicted protein [Sclerotinia sclerotiorum 1980 UF-70]|uniref:Uncharacterized protein n=1 Tax=Sclerotinia sclerotiorum (strain ATCC 18683 / 1980 / Ss-1) TaxID=665079 RepID=A7EF94_SCLS1|nr:predicted protein [Sclerotinia sclerotiorum 1980 UF-70]EDO01510.1 predicted protein [Sclerotinia sclerotiorum 1980 UF-70]